MNRTIVCLLGAMAIVSSGAMAQTNSFSFSKGSPQDEMAIRAIVADSAVGKPDPRIATNLDWENAFGVRYNDLKKRDAFYSAVVSPLQKNDTDSTLEIKIRFLDPNTAVADEYWHIVGQLDIATHKPGPDRWGRTTYICVKRAGHWMEVMERVADLRFAYYKHYDALPRPIAVPIATLASYAGNYIYADDQSARVITVERDHLVVASLKRTRVAIPTSSTDFLLFDPNDLAQYAKLHFARSAGGGMEATLADESGAPLGALKRK